MIQQSRIKRLGPSYAAYTCSKRFVMFYTMANVMRVAAKNNSRIISIAPGHEYLTGCDIIMDGGKFALSTVKQF